MKTILHSRIISVICLMVISIILLASSFGSAVTVQVHAGESIQSAVNDTSPGDSIEVEAGVYPEKVVVIKSLTIRGLDNGTGLPVVNAQGMGIPILVIAENVTLERLMTTGSGSGGEDAGIVLLSRNNNITYCAAFGNGGYGIYIRDSSGNTVEGSGMWNNSGSGLAMMGGGENKVIGNQIFRNLQGMVLNSSQNNYLSKNILTGNLKDGLVLEDESIGNRIEMNEVSGNERGIYLRLSRGNVIKENKVVDNTLGIGIQNQDFAQALKAVNTFGERRGVSIKYEVPGESTIYDVSDAETPIDASNLIYMNVLDNQDNANDDGSSLWDDGTHGNRYSDYDRPEEGCRDRNRDGICDSSHRIEGGQAWDRFPIISPQAVSRKYIATGPSGVEMGLEKVSYLPGSTINVSYSLPNQISASLALKHDDQGLETPGLAANKDQVFLPLDPGPDSVMEITAPLDEGHYQLRMLDDGNSTLALLGIDVRRPSIQADVSSLKTCEELNVTFQGAPGTDNDWIGFFRDGAGDESPLYRSYLDGETNGTRMIYAPAISGSYQVRLFSGHADTSLASSQSIKVEPSAGVRIVASPRKVKPGEKISVSFWGASPDSVIGLYGITSPDRNHIQKVSTGGQPCGTLFFNAPLTPGSYDFRLFQNDVYRQHLGASNVVTVG